MLTQMKRHVFAELLGSFFLAAIVVGSGIAAQQLSPGDKGVQLAENAFATAAGLFVLVLLFMPISGAHFNPVVSLVDAMLGFRSWSVVLSYLPAQLAGGIAGTISANLMFEQPVLAISDTERLSPGHFLAEIVATAGLVLVIFMLVCSDRSKFIPAAVAAYIGAAYFFTSSTSFANPAITIARIFTDSFAGIAPLSAAVYLVAQSIGAAVGFIILLAFYPARNAKSAI